MGKRLPAGHIGGALPPVFLYGLEIIPRAAKLSRPFSYTKRELGLARDRGAVAKKRQFFVALYRD